LLTFATEQEIQTLGDIEIGGQPGERATLAVGSIFYEGQFKDPKSSLNELEGSINSKIELADELGVQVLVDVFIYDESEIDWKVDFVLDTLDGFASFDMPESSVRMSFLEYMEEIGALDRVLYNSINLGITEEERKVLERCTPEAAVILGYDPQDNSTQGRLNMIKGGGKLVPEGLLSISKDITCKLLDTAVTPFGEGASEALRAVPVFKSELGLPTGCAMHNAVEAWEWFQEYGDRERVVQTLDAAIDIGPILFGGDFVYYGPIENHVHELPTVAMIDRIIGEGAETYFGIDVPEGHPYRKL